MRADHDSPPLERAFEWLVAVRGPEADEVREARLRTMPDTWLLFGMCVVWTVGGPVFVLLVQPSGWAVAWLVGCVAALCVRGGLTARARTDAGRGRPPHVALTFAHLAGTAVLVPGIVGSVLTDEPRLVAAGIVLTLGWMSYIASRQAAFPHLGTVLLYLLGVSLGLALLSSPTLWSIGALALTFPVAYQVMMGQNHAIVVSALQAQHANRMLSLRDPLTGLPNRLMMREWVTGRTAARTLEGERGFAVLCLDLDGFKPVNDEHGHQAGDELLVIVGERLQSVLRSGDLACRIGGDEFVVLVDDVSTSTEVDVGVRVAERIIATCSRPYRLPCGPVVEVGVSVGLALYPVHDTDPDVVLAHADAALYSTKQRDKGTWTLHA